ncbi:MAG: signal peptidase II [Candidatus Eremiobacterota bacterium]
MVPLLALAWLVLDQVTKAWVQSSMTLHQSIETPGNLFFWTYIHNRGGAFGLFPGASLLFLTTGVLVTAFLLWSLPRARNLSTPTAVAYSLILGGAVGNLVDRVRYGYVVDFIDLNFWPLKQWPVFNVADIGISVGIGLLVLTSLFSPHAPESSATRSET